MIEQVELHNFKSHRSTKLNFDDSRLHALVGQNSSGKTSVLQALYFLCQLTTLTSKDIFKDQQSPEFIVTKRSNWSNNLNHMSVVVSGFWRRSDEHRWIAGYKLHNKIAYYEKIVLWNTAKQGREEPGEDSSLLNAEIIVKESLRSAAYLKLVSTNLAKAAYSESITPQVGFDGSGLAPTLDYLINEVSEGFQSLQEMLQRIVPGVRKVGVRRAKVKIDRQRLIEVDGKSISYEENQEVAGQEVVLDMNTGDRIPAHAISEGTMITLGLLTVLMSPNRPKLILLDDIEQGLHPNAQRELINVLKEIIQVNQDLQIIFSTHSPYIVDELAPSQVHVLSNSNGFTYSKRLDEHPDVEWAKQTLTTGEFWDAEGEDWVTDGESVDA